MKAAALAAVLMLGSPPIAQAALPAAPSETAALRADMQRLVNAVHDETLGRDAESGASIDPIAGE